MIYKIGEGINAQTSYWENIEYTWNNLKEKLKNPRKTPETLEQYNHYKKVDRQKAKDGAGFVGGYCNNNKRTNETILTRSILTFDFDKCDTTIWNKLERINFECVLYSTHSHRPKSPKIRCIVPLTREINFNEYNYIMRKIVDDLNLWPEIDISCFKITQFMYYPSCSQDAGFFYNNINGKFVDPEDFLKNDWMQELELLKKKDTNKSNTTQGPKNNGRDKTGPIGEFCRKYTITQVLDEFLSEFYEKGQKKNCYTWINGEGTNGLKILDDDSLCISYHSTDPAGSGQQCNAFDLIKIHLCNDDLSKAVKWCADKLGMNEAKNKENLDFSFVKWHPDYVVVKFIDQEKGEMTKRLSEFWNMYQDVEKKPKFIDYKVLPVIENIERLLGHYNLSLKYNLIKRNIEIFHKNKLTSYTLDNTLVKIQDFGIKHGFKPSKEKMEASLIYIAMSNKYNPIHEYLKMCHEKYLKNPSNKPFKDICETIITPEPDKDWYLYHTLLQMVWMGCRSEHGEEEEEPLRGQFLPVFQGVQGSNKTRWFQSLLPKHLRQNYFMSLKVLDVQNKDHLIEVSSNWLVEIGEISSTFKKSDQNSLKAYINDTKDRVRIPYAKEFIDIKRRTCFCGTTNDYEYLTDTTGSRRFLTMGNAELIVNLDIDIDIMWGYFYDLYKKGERYWHTREEKEKVERNNNKYLLKSDNTLIIEDKINLFPENENGTWLSGKEIFAMLNAENAMNTTFGKNLNKFTIGRELKKLNVKMKYDSHKKIELFYVKKL